jgi:hypothetical protein
VPGDSLTPIEQFGLPPLINDRAGLAMSVDRGKPEVPFRGRQDRF